MALREPPSIELNPDVEIEVIDPGRLAHAPSYRKLLTDDNALDHWRMEVDTDHAPAVGDHVPDARNPRSVRRGGAPEVNASDSTLCTSTSTPPDSARNTPIPGISPSTDAPKAPRTVRSSYASPNGGSESWKRVVCRVAKPRALNDLPPESPTFQPTDVRMRPRSWRASGDGPKLRPGRPLSRVSIPAVALSSPCPKGPDQPVLALHDMRSALRR